MGSRNGQIHFTRGTLVKSRERVTFGLASQVGEANPLKCRSSTVIILVAVGRSVIRPNRVGDVPAGVRWGKAVLVLPRQRRAVRLRRCGTVERAGSVIAPGRRVKGNRV